MVEDPRDTPDVMDLAEVEHGHRTTFGGGYVLTHTLRTHDAWGDDLFYGARWDFFLPDGDRAPDRSLLLGRNSDGSFSAEMENSRDVIGFANVWRPDDRSIRVEFPRRLLGKRVKSYRWKLYLSYPCSRDEDVQCEPTTPDTHEGKILHRL